MFYQKPLTGAYNCRMHSLPKSSKDAHEQFVSPTVLWECYTPPVDPPSVTVCVFEHVVHSMLIKSAAKGDSGCVIGATKEAILIKCILDLLSTEKEDDCCHLNLFRFLFLSPADYSNSVLRVLHVRLLNFSIHPLSYLSLLPPFLQWKTLSQLSSVINFFPSYKDFVLIRS